MKGNKYQPEIDTITLQLLAHQFCEFTFTQEYNPGSQSYPTHMSIYCFGIYRRRRFYTRK